MLEDYFEEEEEEEEEEKERRRRRRRRKEEGGGGGEEEEEEEGGGEEEEEEQQQPASAEVAINNGQRNQPNCSAICVFLVAKERAQCARCDMGLCMVPRFTEYHKK